MRNKTFACMGIFVLLTIAGCGNSVHKKEVPAQTVLPITKDATQDDIEKQLGDAASTETNRDSGITADNYENSEFAGHNGQISFYYNEDGSVLYYKWYLSETDKEKAKDIYSAICQALESSYDEGEENNSERSGLYTTSFTNEEQQITAQLQSSKNGYEISYTVVG